MRSVIDAKPWNFDAGALPIPWRDSIISTGNPKIRIGFFAGDAEYPIHPPVMRALSEAVKKLTGAGFTVVQLSNTPPLNVAKELCTGKFSCA
jgi:amidase